MLGPLINTIDNIYLFIILNIFFIIATYTDIKYMKIYDKFNLVMLITRVITFFIWGFSFQYLLGGLLIFIVFLAGAIATKAKIGGDIKFGGNIGLWIGFMPSVFVMLLTIIVNLIYRKITKNVKPIALAPFLYVSFIIVSIIAYLI